MRDLLVTLVPLLCIIGLGAGSRAIGLLHDEVNGFKNIIVKLILPGVLFASFSHTDLSASTWLTAFVMFLLCSLLYGLGLLLHKVLSPYMPYEKSGAFMTGFEFGMMGVGLLSAIWGSNILPLVMPIALGHELFIWFFYAPSLSRKTGQSIHWLDILKQFIKTPTVIGISLGILINALGLVTTIESSFLGTILYDVIGFLTPAVGPLILLYIGYNLQFSGLPLKETLVYSALRWLLVGGAMALGIWVFTYLNPQAEPLFYAGFVGFMLLPPPFIIPLFVASEKAKAFFTQLLLLNTLLSFIGYAMALYVL